MKRLKPEFEAKLQGELEDAVQQAFVVLFRRRYSVDAAEDGLFRYLLTVARNAALDRVRADRRDRERLEKMIKQHRSDAQESPVSDNGTRGIADESEKIWDVFCALDEIERLILWSHVVEEKSIRAVARDLNLNWHKTAKVLDRALRKIRCALDS